MDRGTLLESREELSWSEFAKYCQEINQASSFDAAKQRFPAICESLKAIINCESCSLLLVDPKLTEYPILYLAGSAGYPTHLEGDTPRMELVAKLTGDKEGLGAWTARSKTFFVARNRDEIENHPGHRGSGYQRQWGNPDPKHHCESLLHYQLDYGESRIGLLKLEEQLDKPEESRRFTAAEIQVVRAAAELLVAALLPFVDRDIGRLKLSHNLVASYSDLFGTYLIDQLYEALVHGLDDSIADLRGPIALFVSEVKTPNSGLYETVEKLASDLCDGLGLALATIQEPLAFFKKVEPVFFGIGSYRDHFVHQAQDFLLGLLLILKAGSVPFQDAYKLQQRDFSLSDLIKIHFVASFFHDLGYTLEKIEPALHQHFAQLLLAKGEGGSDDIIHVSWDAFVRNGDYFSPLERLADELWRRIGSNTCHDQHPLRKALHDLLAHKSPHGLLSALYILKRFQGVMNDNLVLEAALCATLHDRAVWEAVSENVETLLNRHKAVKNEGEKQGKKEKKTYYQMTFDQFPLPLLLLFCDETQQWGRPESHFSDFTNERDAWELIRAKSPRLKGINVVPDRDKIIFQCDLAYPRSVPAYVSFFDQKFESFRDVCRYCWTGGRNVALWINYGWDGHHGSEYHLKFEAD